MRLRLFSGVLFALMAVPLCVQGSEEQPAPNLRFGDEEFVFAYEAKTATNHIQEYLPKGQTLKTWTSLAAIHKYPHISDPYAFAQHMGTMVKHQNPFAHAAVGYDQKTEKAIIDFVTWPADRKFVEFNVFLFRRNGEKGLIAYQYAVRAYEDQNAFLTDLQSLRKRAFKTITESGFEFGEAESEKQARVTSATAKSR